MWCRVHAFVAGSRRVARTGARRLRHQEARSGAVTACGDAAWARRGRVSRLAPAWHEGCANLFGIKQRCLCRCPAPRRRHLPKLTRNEPRLHRAGWRQGRSLHQRRADLGEGRRAFLCGPGLPVPRSPGQWPMSWRQLGRWARRPGRPPPCPPVPGPKTASGGSGFPEPTGPSAPWHRRRRRTCTGRALPGEA